MRINHQPSEHFHRELEESCTYLADQVHIKPKMAVILGSGLGEFADSLSDKIVIPASEIPHYPVSTVSGHRGRLIFGSLDGFPLMAVQGRSHFYEGLSFQRVTWVVHMMADIGIKVLIVTNAAGGINPYFKPGDFMLIRDHLNFMNGNPLLGFGKSRNYRSRAASDYYDIEISQMIIQTANEHKLALKEGVLLATNGPTYETAAEIRMIRQIGADAVSMSTIPEVILARQLQIRTAGISLITNPATGLSNTTLSHAEVTAVAEQSKAKFRLLLSGVMKHIGEMLNLNQENI
jgi:purine-nucleoside phosphorylase